MGSIAGALKEDMPEGGSSGELPRAWEGTRKEESEDLKYAHFSSGCLVRGRERRRNESRNIRLMGKDIEKLQILQISYFYASDAQILLLLKNLSFYY